MKRIRTYIQWKTLLAIFKVKRLTQKVLGTRVLDYADKNIRIYTGTVREYHTRAKSCAKEPETCAWITSIKKEGAVLYDIGANIGAYTLIAGAEGMRVVAFEPSPENYATLHRNVHLNGFEKNISVLPVVLGSSNTMQAFDVADATSGATAGFVSTASGSKGAALPVLTLDACVKEFKLPSPYAIKIDVDGGEVEVLRGASETLREPALREVLIEVEVRFQADVDRLLESAGFIKREEYIREEGIYNRVYSKV